jgi:creatinine deaminase
MPFVDPTDNDRQLMRLALAEAQRSYDEGGVPVGSVLVANGRLMAQGHNRRVQEGDPIAHGEMDCLRAAGRRRSYRRTTLYTTLSPCMMCAGTIVLFGIPRVVVGENATFGGNEDFLRSYQPVEEAAAQLKGSGSILAATAAI